MRAQMRKRKRGGGIASNDDGIWRAANNQPVHHRYYALNQVAFLKLAIRKRRIIGSIDQARARQQPRHLSKNRQAA